MMNMNMFPPFNFTAFIVTFVSMLLIYGFLRMVIYFLTSHEKSYRKYLEENIKERVKDITDSKPFSFDEFEKEIKARTNKLNRLKKKYFPFVQIYLWVKNLFKYKIPQGIYYTKCALFYKYNKIKIKTLDPTWCDRDHVLLHAMFQVFVDFIEKEEPFKHLAFSEKDEIKRMEKEKWDDDGRRLKIIENLKIRDKELQETKKEIKFLYNWWKKTYPKLQKDINNDKLHEVENEMMIRLIKVRGHFWT